MKLPLTLQNKVLEHYHLNNFLLLEITDQGGITDYQGDRNILPSVEVNSSIKTLIAGLETETFECDFFIPFYHLNNRQVIDLHHYIVTQKHYLILVPQDQAFHDLQSKQQLALESQLQNQNLQTMLSALQRSQEQLEQANQDKSFLISALSHEMGTPLNSILGHAQIALKAPQESTKSLNVILKSSQHIQKIISQTLNIDEHETQKNHQLFDLNVLLNELYDSLIPLASFKGLSFKIECPDKIALYSQRSQWQQILTNLITNAIKYTDSGGIVIDVKVMQNQLYVDVIDTGIGISTAFQSKLFKAWQREHQSEVQGSGIGLMIAKLLADSIGLTLTLEYSSNKGSCFRICHPTFLGRKQRVLLIEDDEELRHLFVYYLKQLPIEIHQAGSWEEVNQQYSNLTFDIVLTDRHLADGSADDQLKMLHNKADQVFIMTGNPDQKQINHLYQIGFNKVLSKPLTQAQLEHAMMA